MAAEIFDAFVKILFLDWRDLKASKEETFDGERVEKHFHLRRVG